MESISTSQTASPFTPLVQITNRLVFTVFASFALLTSLWALATPLMAVPDEPAHAIRAAAVARGQLIGDLADADTFQYPVVQVPKYIADTPSLPCFSGQPEKAADCENQAGSNDRLVTSATSAASNSPLYYALVGLPTLILSGAPALFAMRLVSAILVSLLFTAMVVALLKQSRSWWPVVAACVAVTPMALFLGGAINPNAIEMAAAGALLASLSLFVRTSLTRAELWRNAAVVVVSAFALTSGRTVALLWLAIIALVLITMCPWRRLLSLLREPPICWALGGIAVAAFTALGWFLFGFSATGESGPIPQRPPGASTVFLITLEKTFETWTGWIGQFGWLDYYPPAGVAMIWHAAILAVLFSAAVFGRGRTRVALILLAVVTILVPPSIQATMFDQAGWIWQGRYGLPLYLCLLIVAGIVLDEVSPTISGPRLRTTVRAGAIVLAVGQLTAFVFVLRRYVVGSESWLQMLREPLWQPPLGWLMLTTLAAAAWVGVIALVFAWTRDSDRVVLGETSLPEHSPLR